MGVLALLGNLYDSRCLATKPIQVSCTTGKKQEEVFANHSNHSREVSKSKVFISGQRNGMNARTSICLGRKAIEHLKRNKMVGCNFLTDTKIDQITAMLNSDCHAMQRKDTVEQLYEIVDGMVEKFVLCKEFDFVPIYKQIIMEE